jgi:transcriptional regulator with XRE-family HTH domain
MQINIRSVSDLGLVVRSVRRSAKVRLDDLAATAGVSKQFASDVEHGKPTVQFGLVLEMLAELGVPLHVDIPEDAEAELTALQSKGGLRPARKRAASAKTSTSQKASRSDDIG